MRTMAKTEGGVQDNVMAKVIKYMPDPGVYTSPGELLDDVIAFREDLDKKEGEGSGLVLGAFKVAKDFMRKKRERRANGAGAGAGGVGTKFRKPATTTASSPPRVGRKIPE